MINFVGKAYTGQRDRRGDEATTVFDIFSEVRLSDPPEPRGMTGQPQQERARRALEQTQRAIRLLEEVFVSMIEEDDLFMPAIERLYEALQETEASVSLLEERCLESY